MKKFGLGILLICSSIQTVSANQNKLIDPFAMVKDINQLYLSVVMDEVNDKEKRSIMCKQLPDKIAQYLRAPQPDKIVKSFMTQAIKSVKSNVELTKNTLNISCKT